MNKLNDNFVHIDLNNFIDLIEKGSIRITFKIGVFKNGPRIGTTHNHGTGFDIIRKDIKMLYDIINY